MNAPVPNLPAPMMAGGQVAALIPQSLEEAFRVSKAIAVSGLAPRGIDKPEQIMVAIMAGAELGLAPFQSLQSFAVVNGRPTLWGDGLLAVVRGRGVRVREWLEGDGDNMVAHCECTRPDTGEQIARQFSVADAKKASLWGKAGPWQQYPKRMLQMRARALSLRDGCADMLRGIQVREEVEDYQEARDVTPRTGTGMRARLEARAVQDSDQQGFSADHVAAQTGAAATDAEFETLDERLDGDNLPEFEASTGGVPGAGAEDEGAAVAREPPPQTAVEGMTRGSDITAPTYLYEDAAEFASVAAGHLDAVKTLADLTALWGQWQADLKRLQKNDLPAYQEVCRVKNARKVELEAEEARG